MTLKMEAMVLCVLMAIAIAVSARPAVTDRSYIDRVVVDQANGQGTLLLVIDIPLEDALTKRRVIRKLDLYASVVSSGELYKKFPNINPAQPIRVILYHPPHANALGASVLEQIQGHAKQLRFVPILQKRAAASERSKPN
jgi:hypothetical protein